MPFDPAKPADLSPLSSAEMRSQLTALDDKITALPVVTAAQVDTTTTGSPGSAAAASVSLSAGTLHFNFDVPQGAEGQQGPAGEVTQSQLSNDLGNTQNAAVSTALGLSSANSNGVPLLSLTPAPNYDPQQFQELVNAYNDLVNALRR